MVTTPGISLYSSIYLKLAKMPCLLIISYIFSSTKLDIRGQNRFCLVWSGGVKVPQTMYTHVSKSKNHKVKKKIK
jgi:hypothetical protein